MLIDKMKQRGFTIVKVDESKPSFIFVNEEGIIAEVYSKKRFEFIYTNPYMLGYLTSGVFDDVLNDGKFEQILIEFMVSVNTLKESV